MSLEAAKISLEGLSVGDAFGECFFGLSLRAISRRELPNSPWRWTDDTQMALSIVEVLGEHGHIEQDPLADAFARRFCQNPHRGYGMGARLLLMRVSQGEDWRDIAPTLFDGGSYGNGGAMRAAPIGGFFTGDPERAALEGRLSAEITHAHPEGQAGAMAVAAAAAIAHPPNRPKGRAYLERVLEYVPEGETRRGIERAIDLPPKDLERAARELGTGQLISAQDTVPFCLWSAAHHAEDYKAAMWHTVGGLGDRDTTCAIVGGIVALATGRVPVEWVARREPLPEDFQH